MTTEPMREAADIVKAHENMVRELVRGHGDPDAYGSSHLQLVKALAAAIELHDARHGPDDGRGETEQENAEGRARLRLSEALSALREDET